MATSAATFARRTPRWWRRSIVLSRRANLFALLEIGALIAFALMVWSTWFAFSTTPEEKELLPSGQVAVLLVGTLIPAMALLVLFGRRMAKRRAAGSTARLHIRLVFFFSLIAAVPTLLVAGFAAFLFQSGVDFWFSDNSRGLMSNANDLAQAYYQENQVEVADETTAMAGDLRFYLANQNTPPATFLASSSFADFIDFQMQGRGVSETVILQQVDDGSLRTAAAYNLIKGNDPALLAPRALQQLRAGEAVFVTANQDRIEAIAPVDATSGIYLYNARNAEANSFRAWEQAQSIAGAYEVLIGRARALQLRFNLALFFVSLGLVGLAVWFALRFADRQVEPLTDLVLAARKVGAGNFAMRVEGRTGSDEIGMLNRAFNRMTAQLEKQTDALVSANHELDDRRAFIEAVVGSVSAGIISIDRERNILLMNSSAHNLLLDNSDERSTSLILDDIAPQISAIVLANLQGGMVSYNKKGELLTLAVKIAPENEGHVITFEDITRQLLDQRQAAWSDVARRIAHEIKNPLTPIQLATERLKRRYRKQIETDGELFDELTNTIVRQVGTLRNMVDEFSSFARLPKPVFRQEDALDLVRQAMFLQEVAHPALDFALSAPEDGTLGIACDRHQFGQAMTNVLKNAVEAVEARGRTEEPDFRGRVAVEVTSNETMVVIAIEDNGVGLPQDRETLTQPYVTTREQGTGLGLAIVNKIVEEHGGDMSFSNARGPDHSGGTRVTMHFARRPRMQTGGMIE